MAKFVAKKVKPLGVDSVVFMDNDFEKLRVLANILSSAKTRGETIQLINDKMFELMHPLDSDIDFEKMMQIFVLSEFAAHFLYVHRIRSQRTLPLLKILMFQK